MQVRPPTRDDAEAVLAVLVARDIADIGRPDIALDDVITEWELPGTDPALDCFVAEDDDGTVTGYAAVDDRGGFVAVHPAAEGRGIGTALREAVERRAAERGDPVASQPVVATNTAAIAHLRAAGYVCRHVYQRMRAPLAAVPPAAATDGLRRFDLDADGEAIHALFETAFAEIPGNVGEPFDRWRLWAARHTDPAHRLVIVDGEGPAAAIIGERWEGGIGYVAQVAVLPRSRGRGHARALLLALAEAFRGDGLETFELSVHGANTPATGLYESVGMTPDFRSERWGRAAA
jgi:ribosomal protein S18 acetylase RimI-like enzyme